MVISGRNVYERYRLLIMDWCVDEYISVENKERIEIEKPSDDIWRWSREQ